MMKYAIFLALIGVTTIHASDFLFEYARQRPARYIQPEESLAGDLPFQHYRSARSLQPEELEGEGPFEYVRAPEESEGEGLFEHLRAPRSLQPKELKDEEPFEYIHTPRSLKPEELDGEGSSEYVRGLRSLQPEALGDGPFENFQEEAEDVDQSDIHELIRTRRSWQGGAPQFPIPGKSSGNAGVDISRQGPNTHATVNAQHGNDRYEVGGQWSKVVRGPNKAKPEWNVHGAIKW